MMEEYELCIIGTGMIGSCAAYYASEILPPGQNLCLIGPEEPQDRSADRDRSIFGAYYDMGRICYSSHQDWKFADLSQRSLPRFQQVQHKSGISFYHDCGALIVASSQRQGDLLLQSLKGATDSTILQPWKTIKNRKELKDYNFEDNVNCMYEFKNAGLINPRGLVKAYQRLAQKAGCQIKRKIVKKVTQQKGNKRHMVLTDEGHVIYANKVLVSTGAFTTFRDLLPSGIRPSIDLKSQTILLAEVSPEDQIKLRNLPVLSNRSTSRWHCYMCPPTEYPDGRYYIKIGHGDQHETDIKTEDQMRRWYQGVAPEEHKQGLREILKKVLPDFEPVSVKTDHCVTTRTPTLRPYIDLLTPSLGVALGGCGLGAKCCDEIGRLAAELVIKGHWSDPELKQTDFMFIPAPKL